MRGAQNDLGNDFYISLLLVLFVETIIIQIYVSNFKWPGLTFWCVNEPEVNVIKQIIIQCTHDVLHSLYRIYTKAMLIAYGTGFQIDRSEFQQKQMFSACPYVTSSIII